MALQFEWYNTEKTIVYLNTSTSFTLQEMIQATDTLQTWVAEIGHPVDLIVDQRDLKRPPAGLLSVIRSQTRKGIFQQIVQVGKPRVLLQSQRQMLNYIPGLKGRIPQMVNTLEEAVELLEDSET